MASKLLDWSGVQTSLHVFFALLLVISCSNVSTAAQAAPAEASIYIVHVSKAHMPPIFTEEEQWYSSTLASVKGYEPQEFNREQEGPIYSYGTVMHGFAAKLTEAQAEALKSVNGVLLVIPDDALVELHTTRTPHFLGLNASSGLWPSSNYGADVIIGIMDSGIWPEKKSFWDTGLSPIPERWKGECEEGTDFKASLCNKKLIGARSFFKGYEAAMGPINETTEYRSARDSEGHGTHTASTAAGNYVRHASLLGSAAGTAKGMASHARIAVYKVCWKGGCFNSDLLAAFEQAVIDGVDIISLSIGGGVLPFFLDPIAIGSFGAMEKGILVSTSAGNGGPSPLSITNVSPWVLTVAASTLDRDFPALIRLPNHAHYRGVSLYDGNALGRRQIPLVYAGNAGLPGSNGSANLCMAGSLDPADVKGKIVLCDRGISARAAKGMVVRDAGGVGMILANALANGEELIADSHVLPAALVGYGAGVAIKDYITQTDNATANIIFTGTVVGVRPAPVMAAFSSRGPNPANPEILKPDVTAPGVNILAAWTSRVGPTELPNDDRVVDFNIMSGTSMSCPHVSGLAALLKGAHPDWSPAAIKSALMTTAFNIDNSGNYLMDGSDSNISTPFSFGAGHVNPVRALNPGLVYDLDVQDYVDFLCGLNYSTSWLSTFTKGQYKCSEGGSAMSMRPENLNYPSISFVYKQDENSTTYVGSITRTVTNVGLPNSVYTLAAIPPPGVAMKVEPPTLSFGRLDEKKTFTVTCEAGAKSLVPGDSDSTFGSLLWTDDTHIVHSPIVFTWKTDLF
ncbi:hypothetical protein GOP47_0025434 [Adiantum capillus-veneris]|uniref:Uncharacterized protein n=1 Tax=Adiantum capillus-veneris TaxID=13818 RepID=A0A9D4U1F9_ADICA|nr:hypothetical protein GOP47_0025434 [Adiantum capillus-veneris]